MLFALCLSCFRVCSLLPCWERADLLALVYDVQCGILGEVWYLIVLIPEFCRLSYFVEWYFSCLFKFK